MWPFVIWNSFGTEMPKLSSQIESSIGTCSTPAALIDSQNIPSAQLALPIVPHATSSPLRENCVIDFNSSSSR